MIRKIDSQILRKARRFLPGLLVLVVFVVSSLPVAAQSTRELNSRINRLENEIQTLSRALFRGEDPPAGAFAGGGGDPRAQANTEIRLQQMEQELQVMRGQVEEQGHEVRQLRDQLQRVMGDIELRVGDLEKGRGGVIQGRSDGGLNYTTRSPSLNAPDVNPPQPKPVVQGGGAVSPQGGASNGYQWNSGGGGSGGNLGSYTQSTETGVVSGGADLAAATYENAFALLKNNQYDAAEKDFAIFLDQYPDHPLAGNAQYWLGETYYVRGNFEKSARIFAEGYQKYPKGSKAADNLLKLGMSLSSLGKKEDACVALSQISKEDFNGAGPVLRRAEQEKSRLGCS